MYVQACFPDIPLSEARYCEWWTHNRPHSCGHQFHFDSDEPKLERGNGAIGDVTHPIFSTIIYLTEGLIGTYSFWTSRSLLHHPIMYVYKFVFHTLRTIVPSSYCNLARRTHACD